MMRHAWSRLIVLGMAVVLIARAAVGSASLGRSTQPTEVNKALIRSYYAEINAGHYINIRRLFAPNYVLHLWYHAGREAGRSHGLTDVMLGAIILRQHVPGGTYSVDDQIAEGDKVVTRWTFQGTPKQRVGSASPGRRVTTGGIDVHRIVGGKIVESWGMMDTASLEGQLGHKLSAEGLDSP
jgi:predicted ester cyclase